MSEYEKSGKPYISRLPGYDKSRFSIKWFEKRDSFIMVRPAGLEPARCYPYAPQTYASADSAIVAYTRREITSNNIVTDFRNHFNTFLFICVFLLGRIQDLHVFIFGQPPFLGAAVNIAKHRSAFRLQLPGRHSAVGLIKQAVVRQFFL